MKSNSVALEASAPINREQFLKWGTVAEGPQRVYRAMAEIVKKQRRIQGLDASSNEVRALGAKELAVIYATEIRSKSLEMDASGNFRPGMNPSFIACPLEAATDADTLGTLAGTVVSLRYLDIFMYKLYLFDRVMTDFSSDPSTLNQTSTTRKVVVPSIVTYDPTLDTDGYPKGWVPANPPQTVDTSITIDELIGVPIQFDLAALSSTQRNLFSEQAPAAAYAMAKYLLAKVYALCTAANFNGYAVVTGADAQGIVKVPTAYATYPVALIDFARSKMSEISGILDLNEVPEEDRTLLLNTAYYNKATNDPSIVTYFAGQEAPEIVTQGRLPNLSGFGITKATTFPGTNNRVGMALQKNGLLVKSRLPANLNSVNPGAENGTVTQIVHPESSMAMLVTMWSDHKRGYSAWNPCAMIGAAVGDKRGGMVLTSQ